MMVRAVSAIVSVVLILLTPSVLSERKSLREIIRSFQPTSLQNAYQCYQEKNKFQHGVFSANPSELEAIRVKQAADGSRLVELAKRATIPKNRTLTGGTSEKNHPTNQPSDTAALTTELPKPTASFIDDLPSTTGDFPTDLLTALPTSTNEPDPTQTAEESPDTTAPPDESRTIRITTYSTSRRTKYVTGKDGKTSTSVQVVLVSPTQAPSYGTETGSISTPTSDATLQNTSTNNASAQFWPIAIGIVAAIVGAFIV